jgi:2',3'-cyclic-nucleotide 2'-phosphodiesterase (5'-nucleotidase family)
MENYKQPEVSQKVYNPNFDVERIRLTSKTYYIKNQTAPKFCSKSIILSILIIIIFYLSMLVLYPFINQFKAMMVREMSEQNGNLGLNQNYSRVKPNDKNYIYIPIVGTDDIHGNFFPKVNHIKIDGEDLTYKTGGLEFVARYINILREEFGANRVLYFDGGDFYQGGLASVLFDGEIMQDFFNIIGLNGSTIGNHEFDYSRKWIESKINKAKYKTLVNNIVDNTTSKKGGALGKNHQTSHIYTIKLDNNDEIKIGVIGLTFNMKNDKKMPNTWGNRATWDNIQFFSYMTELEQESKLLREKGASAVIALTHFGLVCNQTMAMKLDMYNKSSIQGKCFRDDEDSVLYKLLDIIKPGVLDGIIGGDTHMEMHHWENNIPMMSVPTHARYLNIMYLPFKKNEDGNYTLVNDEIKIEGPLPACEKIFKNYQNCELISSKEYEEAGELITYAWHGQKIERDPMIEPIYDKYYQRYKDYAEQKIVTFQGFDKIKVDKSGDCILCNTYLDAIKEIKGADFAIINRGIFPEELVPCTLTREDFYNQMPYLDKICTVDITGNELIRIISTVQSIGKSFYPTSSLKQTIIIDKEGNKTVTDIELYVNDEAIPIEDERIYKMASSMYILSETSGEDFAKGDAYEIIYEKVINHEVQCSEKTMDDEMAEFFKGRGTIDLSSKVNPECPRIIKIYE